MSNQPLILTPEVTEIDQIVRIITRLQLGSHFNKLDALLKSQDLTQKSVGEIVAIVRSSYSTRNMTPSWKPLLEKAYSELIQRDESPMRLLRGLKL